MKKNIRRIFVAMLILGAVVVVTYFAIMIYGAFLLMSANNKTEQGIVELQTIDDKASKIQNLLFCQMTKKEQKKLKAAGYPIEKETCSVKRSFEEIEGLRLQMCKEIKDDLDKSIYGKVNPRYYARYIEDGTCSEKLLNENEKKDIQEAVIEVKKINKMDEVGRKISILQTCKIKAGLIIPKPGETAIGDQSTYEDYVKLGYCPRKAKLKKIDEKQNQFCESIKEIYDSLKDKKELEMRHNLYVDGKCMN